MEKNKERDAADKRQERLETFLCQGLVLHLQSVQERATEELDAIQDVIEKRARTVTKKTLDLFKQAGELEAKRDAEMLAAQRAENEIKEIKGDTEEDEAQREHLRIDYREHTAHATLARELAAIAKQRAAVKEVKESLKRKRAKTPDKKK